MQDQPTRPMTAGEKAVGLNFNHAQGDTHDKVHKLKTLAAQMFDIVEQAVDLDRDEDADHTLARSRKMRDAALHEIVTAQMWAVKSVTLGK